MGHVRGWSRPGGFAGLSQQNAVKPLPHVITEGQSCPPPLPSIPPSITPSVLLTHSLHSGACTSKATVPIGNEWDLSTAQLRQCDSKRKIMPDWYHFCELNEAKHARTHTNTHTHTHTHHYSSSQSKLCCSLHHLICHAALRATLICPLPVSHVTQYQERAEAIQQKKKWNRTIPKRDAFPASP